MDIYQWRHKYGEAKTKSPHLPPPTHATTVSVRWNGALTPMLIEPIEVTGTIYFAFRPFGAPKSSGFVVGQDASGGDDFGNINENCDAFGFRDEGALCPFRSYHERNYRGVEDLVRRIERGWYGRLDLQTGERQGCCQSAFYGSRGRLIRDEEGDVLMGMMMTPGMSDLREADYDPPLPALPWCDAAQAPELLARLDNAQLADYIAEQQADATTAAGFAHAWLSWPHAERRAWLPPLERDIEDELCRVMKWIYWSAPQLKQPEDFPETRRRPQQWIRPRFVVQSEGAGEFFFDARWFAPDTGEKMQLLEQRLTQMWPFIERAFATQRTKLRLQRRALPPSVAHWCYRRGCYNVTFAPPTAHELIESRVALREWLWTHANADLDSIERAL